MATSDIHLQKPEARTWGISVRESISVLVLEKTLESLLDSREIKPVNLKGNQPWILIGRTDAEVEAPILWPPDAKNWLIGKDPDAGKDWGQEEKGTTEDEMVGWHHWLSGHEPGQTPRGGEGQGSLACCSPWGHKGSDTTERLNTTTLLSFRLGLHSMPGNALRLRAASPKRPKALPTFLSAGWNLLPKTEEKKKKWVQPWQDF